MADSTVFPKYAAFDPAAALPTPYTANTFQSPRINLFGATFSVIENKDGTQLDTVTFPNAVTLGVGTDKAPLLGQVTYAYSNLEGKLLIATIYANAASDDLTTGNLSPLNTSAVLYGVNSDTGNLDRIRAVTSNADAIPSELGNLAVFSYSAGFNGATFDRVRVANVFKTAFATAAGETAVWTPTGGKKFRLMGYTISVAGTLAATGTNRIQLLDGTGGTVIANHIATLTDTTPTGDTQMGADWGQGFLSGAADRILRVKLASAVSNGGVAVNAWGTEE